MTEEGRARGISLWLMPEGGARERLSRLIDGLAKRLGTEPFAPHVTLLPGLAHAEADVLEEARSLASSLGPFTARFSGIDGENDHFRCLFLRLQDEPRLREAHARASRRFGKPPNPFFDAHLSLVYGRLGPQVRDGLIRELTPEAARSIEMGRLHAWRTEGPVRQWRELGAFPLEGSDES